MPSTPLPGLALSPLERNQLRLIECNRLEYGYRYDLLTFASSDRLLAAEAERLELLQWLAMRAALTAAAPKVRRVHSNYHIPISNTATAVMALEAV